MAMYVPAGNIAGGDQHEDNRRDHDFVGDGVQENAQF